MYRVSLIALPLLLAGCGDGGNSTAEKTESAQAATNSTAPATSATGGSQTKLQPGQWETVAEMVSAEIPGAPQNMLRDLIGKKQTQQHCLTPEQAANPDSDFFNNPGPDSSCKPESFSMSGGRMNAAMTCSDPSKGEMRMAMSGTYQQTSYDLTATMEMPSPQPGQKMKMTTRIQGRHLGACTTPPTTPAPATN